MGEWVDAPATSHQTPYTPTHTHSNTHPEKSYTLTLHLTHTLDVLDVIHGLRPVFSLVILQG